MLINNWEQEIRPGDLVFYGGSGKSLGCFVFEFWAPHEWQREGTARLISFAREGDIWDRRHGRMARENPQIRRHATIAHHPLRLLKIDELPPVVTRDPQLFRAYEEEQIRLRLNNGQ